MSRESEAEHALALAERILNLLSQGRKTSIYKHAVLLGLIDLCQEGVAKTDAAFVRDTITTRQLAEKVIELLWTHTRPYAGLLPPARLLSNRTGQAEIISLLGNFQGTYVLVGRQDLEAARRQRRNEFAQLVADVEWKLIEMPLPRLQVVGNQSAPMLYEINWDANVERNSVFKAEFRKYVKAQQSTFDNRIRLLPGVAEALIRLGGVLRPLIQQQWVAEIAAFNELQQDDLQRFLFGEQRVALVRMRGPLVELQNGRCFYCENPLDGSVEIDHFVPWSRHPDNGIYNLVGTHKQCNSKKSDFFASSAHLVRWRKRCESSGALAKELERIADELEWPTHRDTTLHVARSVYARLPAATPLWIRGDEFEALRREAVAI
jgi:hypothetical protein